MQEEVTGIPRHAVLGKTDYDIFQKNAADTFRRMDEHVILTGETVQVDEEEVHPAGAEKSIWLRTVKTAVDDHTNGHNLLLGVSEDISERKRLGENLSRTHEQLKQTQLQLIQAEKMESIGRLAAGVAHEVKNPLALMLMGVEYLDGGIDPNDENVPEIIEEMRNAITRADKIIRGLVDFSSSRQLDLKLQPIEPVIEEVLLFLRHDFTRANLEAITEFAEELPPILLDNGKIEQVLINLIINAMHAMENQQNPQLRIRTSMEQVEEVAPDEGARTADRLRAGDQVVVVELIDNGPGVPADKLTKIFDPFYTTKATGVGTGLGLSVVRNIVELHHGTVEIRNRPEGGAWVQIRLRSGTS